MRIRGISAGGDAANKHHQGGLVSAQSGGTLALGDRLGEAVLPRGEQLAVCSEARPEHAGVNFVDGGAAA